jgi:hypothetical protein
VESAQVGGDRPAAIRARRRTARGASGATGS